MNCILILYPQIQSFNITIGHFMYSYILHTIIYRLLFILKLTYIYNSFKSKVNNTFPNINTLKLSRNQKGKS